MQPDAVHSLPSEVLAALDGILAAFTAVRSQMRNLEAAEMVILAGAEQVVDALTGTGMSLDMAHRTVHTELAAAARETERTIGTRSTTAAHVVSEYPNVFAQLTAGHVSGAHAKVICDAGAIITDDAQRGRYEDAVLALAVREPVARLRPLAKHLAEQYAEERSISERHAQARERRSVMVIDAGDGMADLIAHLPAACAYGIKDRLDQFARHLTRQSSPGKRRGDMTDDVSDNLPRAGSAPFVAGATAGETEAPALVSDSRTFDQVRADVLTDLLLRSGVMSPDATEASPEPGLNTGDAGDAGSAGGTGSSGGSGTRGVRPAPLFKARVQVIVPIDYVDPDAATPLEGIPPTIEGYGPIDADTARFIAGEAATWERVRVGPEGDVISVDTYRPSTRLRQYLGARDLHCRFYGCSVPLRRCDIDHTTPASTGGRTSSTNLGHLCRRHHVMKHATPWRATQLRSGDYLWESPTGKTYRDTPHSRVRFRPARTHEGDPRPAGAETPAQTPPQRPSWKSKESVPF